LIAFAAYPYSTEIRAELMALYAPDAPHAVARLCSLNIIVGERFAEAAIAICRKAEVDVIAEEEDVKPVPRSPVCSVMRYSKRETTRPCPLLARND
jgi:hypothetical protein